MKAYALVLTGLAVGIAAPAAFAQDKSALPASGSFKLHSGWKGVGDSVQVGENHTFGTGNFWGVTFNDAGSGALHLGTVVCPYTLDTIGGASTGQGTCAWSDADGDKIFTSYSGKGLPSGSFDGVNKITGGTGKFKDIQGQAPFQCQFLNDKGQANCTQQFEYQLTAGAKQ